MYKGYLIDLDGVAYLGNKVIPTCRDFIERIKSENRYCFVTNNSSRTVSQIYEALKNLGYSLTADNIITSSQVTVNYLKNQNRGNRVFVIGMTGIRTELENNGFEIVESNADYVVVGLDFELNYDKMKKAIREIANGAAFISTNSDIRLATADGIVPGNGAVTELLHTVTNVSPLYMGKPAKEMLEYGIKKLNLEKRDVAMIGDNYFTDILGAVEFGIDSIFVETGVMKITDLAEFEKKPTVIVKDLSYIK